MVMMIRWSRIFPYETITFNITEWIQTEQQPNTYSRSYFGPSNQSFELFSFPQKLHNSQQFYSDWPTWLSEEHKQQLLIRFDLCWWLFHTKLRPVDLLIVFPGNGVFLTVSPPNSPWFCRWPPVAFPQNIMLAKTTLSHQPRFFSWGDAKRLVNPNHPKPRDEKISIHNRLLDTPPKTNGWNPKMKVWFRWFSFSNEWFSGSMFVFWGVYLSPCFKTCFLNFLVLWRCMTELKFEHIPHMMSEWWFYMVQKYKQITFINTSPVPHSVKPKQTKSLLLLMRLKALHQFGSSAQGKPFNKRYLTAPSLFQDHELITLIRTR